MIIFHEWTEIISKGYLVFDPSLCLESELKKKKFKNSSAFFFFNLGIKRGDVKPSVATHARALAEKKKKGEIKITYTVLVA